MALLPGSYVHDNSEQCREYELLQVGNGQTRECWRKQLVQQSQPDFTFWILPAGSCGDIGKWPRVPQSAVSRTESFGNNFHHNKSTLHLQPWLSPATHKQSNLCMQRKCISMVGSIRVGIHRLPSIWGEWGTDGRLCPDFNAEVKSGSLPPDRLVDINPRDRLLRNPWKVFAHQE